ncbi:helix-turn-helix transcriptional regulator [Alishewanella sp. HL-SH06]|uniref:helix-turn-helix transcriptional regulator n=1 Tax=Alishewanella sp. HL-SH06 TaxID=3461144 RepID=UPI000BCAD05E|nr:MAG: DNA-binding protein [Alishewanella sp. 32-51-5]
MTETSGQERLTLLSQIEADINSGAISLGEAIRRIRTELYGMTQTQYAAYTKVSDKTLREIEKGHTDARLSNLSKLLAPGDFKISARFVPRKIT